MKKTEKKNKSPKKLIIGVSCSLAIIPALVIWLASGSEKPPEPNGDINKNLSYLASDNFTKLPEDKKAEYLQKLRENNTSMREIRNKARALPEDQRNKLRENMRSAFRTRMRERVKKYFDLKTQEEKDAYLDEAIDRMEEFRKRRAQAQNDQQHNNNEQQNSQGNRRRGFSPDRLKKRIENTDPQTRAQMAEFRNAMRARMAERRQ
jgi:hypothetical protein